MRDLRSPLNRVQFLSVDRVTAGVVRDGASIRAVLMLAKLTCRMPNYGFNWLFKSCQVKIHINWAIFSYILMVVIVGIRFL